MQAQKEVLIGKHININYISGRLSRVIYLLGSLKSCLPVNYVKSPHVGNINYVKKYNHRTSSNYTIFELLTQ